MEQIQERLVQYHDGLISAQEFASHFIKVVGDMYMANDEQAIYNLSAVLFRGLDN